MHSMYIIFISAIFFVFLPHLKVISVVHYPTQKEHIFQSNASLPVYRWQVRLIHYTLEAVLIYLLIFNYLNICNIDFLFALQDF